MFNKLMSQPICHFIEMTTLNHLLDFSQNLKAFLKNVFATMRNLKLNTMGKEKKSINKTKGFILRSATAVHIYKYFCPKVRKH